VLLLLVVLAYPLAWEVWTSFTALSPLQEGGTAFVGLANYRQQLGSAEFWQAATITVGFAIVTSILKLGLGLGMALLLVRPFRGRALVFLAIFLPWAYPASVSVIGWFWMLNPPVTTAYAPFMGQLKQSVDSVLGTGAWAFISVTLFNIWRGSSFIGVLLLAGMNAVPPELFEYALLDSKSAWQRFRSVTVPLLKPFLALGVFLSLTSAFADLAKLQSDAGAWRAPSLVIIGGTPIGAAPYEQFFGPTPPVDFFRANPLIENHFDALLYLGTPSAMTTSPYSYPRCAEPDYVKMRVTRMVLSGMPANVGERLTAECAASASAFGPGRDRR